jgi:regulator of sigma E protease
LYGEKPNFTVLRNGIEKTIFLPADFLNRLTDNKAGFLEPIVTFKIGEVSPSLQTKDNKEDAISPATKAGLKAGDEITAINNNPVLYYHQFKELLQANAGKKVDISYSRKGLPTTVNVRISDSGKIGIMPTITSTDLTPVKQALSFGQALNLGYSKATDVITGSVKGYAKIFSGQLRADKAILGPIEIAQLYGQTWDWDRFWTLTAILSMGLAFMNILPIPALDGGHALFLLYEMILGRTPSVKFMERAQAVGTFILLALMVFVIGNGIFKLFQ